MMVRFFDRQDVKSSLSGTAVGGASELRRLLAGVRDREPFFAELIGENGFTLLLGIGASTACVQYSAADGAPPYLMAIARDALGTAEGEVEVSAARTPRRRAAGGRDTRRAAVRTARAPARPSAGP